MLLFKAEKRIQQIAACSKFGSITFLELGPLASFVPEPLAQLLGSRDVAHTTPQLRFPFAYAPRPQTVNEDAKTILRGCRFVYAFDQNRHGNDTPISRQAGNCSYGTIAHM